MLPLHAHLMFIITILALALIKAPASEFISAKLQFAKDGDTIEVTLLNSPEHPSETVRLLFLDTPEKRDNAHGKAMPEGEKALEELRDLVFNEARLQLWSPTEGFTRDKYGRLLAVAIIEETGGDTIQEKMIRAGWSSYWRKYGDLAAYPVLHERFNDAQRSAQRSLRGVWLSNPSWIRESSLQSVELSRTPAEIAIHIPIPPTPMTEQPPVITANSDTKVYWGSFNSGNASGSLGHSSTYGAHNDPPPVAGNGDVRGADNDGDGRAEGVYVRPYTRADGTHVRSHYRASRR